MKLEKAIGMRIVDLLIKNNTTRYAFCKKICMPQQTLKHIIDERNKNIYIGTIYEIAKGFNLSLEKFFASTLFADDKIGWAGNLQVGIFV